MRLYYLTHIKINLIRLMFQVTIDLTFYYRAEHNEFCVEIKIKKSSFSVQY